MVVYCRYQGTIALSAMVVELVRLGPHLLTPYEA